MKFVDIIKYNSSSAKKNGWDPSWFGGTEQDSELVKQIKISSSADPLNLKVRFELKTSILEDEDSFIFSSVETSIANLQLGYIMRKEKLPKLADYFGSGTFLEEASGYK